MIIIIIEFKIHYNLLENFDILIRFLVMYDTCKIHESLYNFTILLSLYAVFSKKVVIIYNAIRGTPVRYHIGSSVVDSVPN